MSLISAILIGFLSILVPGFFVSLALLRKTEFGLFEIAVMGFLLGMILVPMAVWLESYLIPYEHIFSFSAPLYAANAVAITIIGIVALALQGGLSSITQRDWSSIGRRGSGARPAAAAGAGAAAKEIEADYRKRLAELRTTLSRLKVDMKVLREHEKEEEELAERHAEEMHLLKDAGPEERSAVAAAHRRQEQKLYEQHEREERMLLEDAVTPIATEGKAGRESGKRGRWWVLLLVFGLMVITFATRFENISVAPQYFEFDPYFDMVSTQYILTYGYQLGLDTSAWPTAVNGTNHRAEPLIPYLEAYWYDIAGPQQQATIGGTVAISSTAPASPNTNLLSLISSYYPPIAAALLVFIIFIMLYHLYGDFPAIIGAVLATAMPVLISTFIAGEQLLEPFGILLLFFFLAAYLLAAENPKEHRYAVLAAIAFAANFLGAQYYTIPAAILAIYIIVQGLFNVLKDRPMRDFYKMNIIVIAIFTVIFALYIPYAATLQNRIPSYFGVPTIVSFPIGALLVVALFQYLPVLLKRYGKMDFEINLKTYLVWLAVLIVALVAAVLATPLGAPVDAYLALSAHFTTPSSPLFLTVQEYAPTGLNYDFGTGGFGLIAASIFGYQAILWPVLIVFVLIELYGVFFKGSQSGIMVLAFVLPLAFAGMSEAKYLPHFGAAYIICIAIIFGEAIMYIRRMDNPKTLLYAVYAVGSVIIVAEFVAYIGLGALPAALNQNCTTIDNAGNSVGADLFCNTVPTYWLNALAWMRSNVGPTAPRVLAWWDYGDWINWFGNSNAVIRGDNAVPQTDYNVAANYVLGQSDGFGPASLAAFMNASQAKYVLFDNELVPKWGALDFLACIDINQTTQAYAEQEGKLYKTDYVLGTSPCETEHDPVEVLVPYNVTSVSDFCSISNSSSTNSTALIAIPFLGDEQLNFTYCLPASFLETGNPTRLLYQNGTKSNAVATVALYDGLTDAAQNEPFYVFTLIYLPNGPNDTVTDAPSQFYDSNYYRGFFLGSLPGFTLAYPDNFTGVNYVNTTADIMIYSLDNFSGTLPAEQQKPSYVDNSYDMPS